MPPQCFLNGGRSKRRTISSGLGTIYADRLARRGHDLILVARRKSRLESLSQDLRNTYGVHVEALSADLGNAADFNRVYERVAADEQITILVNNAGTSLIEPAIETPIGSAEQIINVNTKALTLLSLAVLPRFVNRNDGTIINIGSVLSLFNFPGATPYCVSKADVMMFTLGLQRELQDTKVRIQLVLPSATATEIWDVVSRQNEIRVETDLVHGSVGRFARHFRLGRADDGVCLAKIQSDREIE